MAGEAWVRIPLGEIDQIREAADKPEKRFHLFISFAKARLVTIDELRSDPKLAQGRGQQIHDLLEDFQSLLCRIYR